VVGEHEGILDHADHVTLAPEQRTERPMPSYAVGIIENVHYWIFLMAPKT
jgi:hypothetical protein